MKQHKQDRRSQRTYHLVRTAMMALLLEKRYDAITVQDILDRADIGRSTFYTHFYDKEDVLVSATGARTLSSSDERAKWRSTHENGADALEQKYRAFPDNCMCWKTFPHNSTGSGISVPGRGLSEPAQMVA
jgi:AcrR family transcriptional regulator